MGGLGGSVLLGWLLGSVALAGTFPSFSDAADTTAEFLFIAIAVLLLGDERPALARRVTVRVLAAIVFTLGLTALLAPGPEPLRLGGSLGRLGLERPTWLTSVSFVAVGAALAGFDLEAGPLTRRAVDGLLAMVGLVSLGLFVGHMHGVPEGGSASPSHAVAANTYAGLVLSSLAILLARPTRGPMRLLLRADLGARLLRTTLPAIVVVPIAFNALRLLGESAGYYGPGAGIALAVLGQILTLSLVIGWSARGLARGAEAQRSAMERLGENEEALRITLDSIGGGVIVTDAAGCVVHMSRRAERSTGYTLKEVLGARLDERLRVVDGRTRQVVESPFEHVVRTGSLVGVADRLVVLGADGTERAVLDDGAPVLNRLGILRGALFVLRREAGDERQPLGRSA